MYYNVPKQTKRFVFPTEGHLKHATAETIHHDVNGHPARALKPTSAKSTIELHCPCEGCQCRDPVFLFLRPAASLALLATRKTNEWQNGANCSTREPKGRLN